MDNGSKLLVYPNKYYNIDINSGTSTKHIFTPSGELIATIISDRKKRSFCAGFVPK